LNPILFEIDHAHEKSGFLNFDLPPEAPDLNHVLRLIGQIHDRTIKFFPQLSIQDRRTLMTPATVVMQDQTEWPQLPIALGRLSPRPLVRLLLE
jgi:hypothetical protein